MTFAEKIAPYVQQDLKTASKLVEQGLMSRAFKHLEDAHVLGQQSTKWHVVSHWMMLLWAVRARDLHEIFGQIIRLLGAATKTFIGFVPTGNTGGASVSIFRPIPLSKRNAEILASIENYHD